MQEQQILQKFSSLDIRRAIIFDDKVKLTSEQWQGDDSLWTVFCTQCQELLEQELGVIEFENIRGLTNISKRLEAFELINKKVTISTELIYELNARSGSTLKRWIEKLKEWGLQVDEFTSWQVFEEWSKPRSPSDTLMQYQIVLLDYDFDQELGGAKHSDYIASKVSEIFATHNSLKNNVPLPILVMFSAQKIQNDEKEKSEFTTRVRFVRGCYEFLPKEAVFEEEFTLRFLQLIKQAELGKLLHSLGLNVAVAISDEANKEFMDILHRLDPQSIQALSIQRLYKEGITLQDYFVQLFSGLLQTTLSNSEAVSQAIKQLLDEMEAVKEPSIIFDHIGLCQVQNRLLFNYGVNKFRQPIDLGDIFIFENNGHVNIGILITQSCDLLVRGNIASQKSPQSWQSPKANRVTLLLGSQVELPGKGEDSTRYFAASNGDIPDKAIDWNFTNPIVLPRAVLDFVTLGENGQAVIPLNSSPTPSTWWSEAYMAYIQDLVTKIQADLSNTNVQSAVDPSEDSKNRTAESSCEPCLDPSNENVTTSRSNNSSDQSNISRRKVTYVAHQSPNFGQLIVPDDINSSSFSTLGGGAIYTVKKENGFVILPIRRVARLQLTETLRIQHKFHTNSSRIGVMTDLRQITYFTSVKIMKNRQGAQLGVISAQCIQVDDSCSSLRISSEEFKRFCQACSEYEPLIAIATTRSEFDLWSAVKLYPEKYKLSCKNREWKLEPSVG